MCARHCSSDKSVKTHQTSYPPRVHIPVEGDKHQLSSGSYSSAWRSDTHACRHAYSPGGVPFLLVMLTCVCMCRGHRVLSLHCSSFYFLETVSLLNLELDIQAILIGQRAPGILPWLSPLLLSVPLPLPPTQPFCSQSYRHILLLHPAFPGGWGKVST